MAQQSEFRRGWPVVTAAFVGITTGVGAIPFYSIGPFMTDLEASFGWTRTEVSWSLTFLAFALFVASPIAGRIADQRGVKIVAVVSSVCLALCLASLVFLQPSIWMLFGIYALAGIVAAGSGPVTYTKALTAWFDKHRGLAFGLALTGTGVAGFFTPLVIQAVSDSQGWRFAWLALAAFPLLALPIIIWGLRGREAHEMGSMNHLVGVELNEALRDYRFWVLGAALFFISLFVAGFVVHMVPMLTDQGVSRVEAAGTASLIGLAVIAGRLLVGFAMDRIYAPYVAVAVFSCTALGCWMFASLGPEFAPIAAILLGAALGAEVDLIAYLVSRYFGLKNYGQIYGWQYGFYVSGAALSPVLVALIRGQTGGYDTALLIGAVVILLSGFLFLTLGRYRSFEPAAA